MGVSFEWVSAANCGIQVVGDRFDVREYDYVDEDDVSEETTVEGAAIILGCDSGFVITAQNKEALIEFAKELLIVVSAFEVVDAEPTGGIYATLEEDHEAGVHREIEPGCTICEPEEEA